MDTTDAALASRRRLAQVGLIALGALAWLAGLAAVGSISSRTDPIIGESAHNLVFPYVLLLPAFLWLGVHLGRRRDAARTRTVDLEVGRRRFLVDGAIFAGATVVGGAARPLVFAASDPQTPTSMITEEHGPNEGPRGRVACVRSVLR